MERRLTARSNHDSMIQIAVPSTASVFGYVPGSPEETICRRKIQRLLRQGCGRGGEFHGKAQVAAG